ncbi:MAG: penicillin-binding transpeptidase domain-containing protein [Candidatus Magasanikbacteria bacterium]|nr:penicillin-binding transpeptidase domain-containing protein [Candidatus Magasanikbacteria bacterium]
MVENHYHAAKIPGYYVAGKTGTAQIAENGKYSADRTNHTFAGFAPASNPQFVLVVKYEEPQRLWAEQTTLPVFRDLLTFALQYYAVPNDK